MSDLISGTTQVLAARVPNAMASEARATAHERGLTVTDLIRVALTKELRAA